MLQVLRDSHNTSYIKLSQQFCDLNWFHVFLKQYNGVTFFDNKPVDFQVYLNASLSGLGGCIWTLSICPSSRYTISAFAYYTVRDAKRCSCPQLWSQVWANKKVKICCDNQALVEVLNTGKTKYPFLATCARNVWLITAIFNIEIIVIHVPDKNNPIADLLSRWVITINPENKLRQYLPHFI